MSSIETKLTVSGMTCGGCASHVERALRRVDLVSGVEVQLREGIVKVTHDPGVPRDALVDAVREAGYPAT